MSKLDASSLLSDPEPLWRDPPTGTGAAADDPLALALPFLVRYLGVAAAVEAVVGPTDEQHPAASGDVLPALRRIGFDAQLVHCAISELHAADLPAVLVLRGGDACVLLHSRVGPDGQNLCSVVLPGEPPQHFTVPEAEIAAEYSGAALRVRRPARSSTALRAGASALPASDPLAAVAAAVLSARLSLDAATPPHSLLRRLRQGAARWLRLRPSA